MSSLHLLTLFWVFVTIFLVSSSSSSAADPNWGTHRTLTATNFSSLPTSSHINASTLTVASGPLLNTTRYAVIITPLVGNATLCIADIQMGENGTIAGPLYILPTVLGHTHVSIF